MSKEEIKRIVSAATPVSGMVASGIDGVQFFRMTETMRCAPAVYEPCVVAILGGAKEAILDGEHYVYDASQYMCCPISMPVEAGTPQASPEAPLLGVYISLDARVMTELAIEMARTAGFAGAPRRSSVPQGLALAHWDDAFTDALCRLLRLTENPAEAGVLSAGRLRELYYTILKGEAGASAHRAFGVGNEIARAIDYLSSRLDQSVTIEDMAAQVGMSRAVLHRKFKQATRMSPIQFMKSMRLNQAAMKIASGVNVSAAAAEVGYISSSQFSREFKRMYGQTPRQWRHASNLPAQFG